MDEGLCGQVAILTGPPTPLSLTVARHLGNTGVRLVFAGRNISENRELLAVINQFRRDALCFDADLNDVREVRAVLEAVERSFARVDMLIHNLGGGQGEWRVVRSTALVWNGGAPLHTALTCSSGALQHMAERRHGHIVHLVTRDEVGALEVEQLVLSRLQQTWMQDGPPSNVVMSTVYFAEIASLLPGNSPRREERVVESSWDRVLEEDDWAARVILERQIGDLFLEVCRQRPASADALQSFDFSGGGRKQDAALGAGPM
jgi:hypothetical protein